MPPIEFVQFVENPIVALPELKACLPPDIIEVFQQVCDFRKEFMVSVVGVMQQSETGSVAASVIRNASFGTLLERLAGRGPASDPRGRDWFFGLRGEAVPQAERTVVAVED